MADKDNPVDRWQAEWRRNGAGMIGASFLVGGGWISASQTFVTSTKGQLVHPSPWGWLLYVCIGGIALGSYAWVATYVDTIPKLGWPVPMFGRTKAGKDARQAAHQAWLNESRSRMDNSNPIQVEIVGDRGKERRIPFGAPESYQIAQYRQALAKFKEIRDRGFDDFGLFEIEGMLRAAKRTDKDRTYEPMHVSANQAGLAALVASGELIDDGNGRYRLPPEESSETL
jgi:hypothetical protein